ncbi:MAG: SIS domain-containing protein [Bacteroidetes bacterium]|nr:SIS domain-containing protein [Bacteroidota bacterium]
MIKTSVLESIHLKQKLLSDAAFVSFISGVSEAVSAAFNNGRKLLIAGNGGSFADAIHLAAEFVGRFREDRKALPAVALGANQSVLTSVANDYSFAGIFSRETEAIGNEGDILLVISTSGNSPNIVQAIHTACEKKIKVFGLTGKTGGVMKDLCECYVVPSDNTARIQEVHIMAGHIICELSELKVMDIRS